MFCTLRGAHNKYHSNNSFIHEQSKWHAIAVLVLRGPHWLPSFSHDSKGGIGLHLVCKLLVALFSARYSRPENGESCWDTLSKTCYTMRAGFLFLTWVYPLKGFSFSYREGFLSKSIVHLIDCSTAHVKGNILTVFHLCKFGKSRRAIPVYGCDISTQNEKQDVSQNWLIKH